MVGVSLEIPIKVHLVFSFFFCVFELSYNSSQKYFVFACGLVVSFKDGCPADAWN